jgi:hypothetical protein
MKLSINGLGLVSTAGDVADLERLLAQSRIEPELCFSNSALPFEFSSEFKVPSQLVRRMGRFAKLSLLSAGQAICDSGLELAGRSVGIIQGSVYGPINSGLQAFDDLIDFGDNQLSPTNFSGSVFNTAATYLSLAFSIQGPVLTHTSGLDTLYNSFLTASKWLEDKEVDYVILGVGDEYTPYFDGEHAANEHQSSLLPTSEGWTTFLLGRNDAAKFGKLRFSYLKSLPSRQNQYERNVYSIWHKKIESGQFSVHARERLDCFPVHLRGSYPSASAFDLALALICKRNRRFPIYDGFSLQYRVEHLDEIDIIRCFSLAEGDHVACYELLND